MACHHLTRPLSKFLAVTPNEERLEFRGLTSLYEGGVAEEIDLAHEDAARRKKKGVNDLLAFSFIPFYSNWAYP